MPGIVLFQTNFSSGELDPKLRARTDLEQYANGLETALNVLIQPQGGVKRRPGTKTCSTWGSNANFQYARLIPFEYSVDDTYVLVIDFYAEKIYVFDSNGDQIIDINGTLDDWISTSFGISYLDAAEVQYVQAVDTLIFVHPTMHPKRLIRNANDNWTFEDLPLTNIPQYAFYLDTHAPNFTITPSEVSGNITITASAVTTDTGTAQAGSTDTITLKAASSFTSDDQPNGMFIEITSGTGVGQTRHVEDYVASTKVLTVYPDWDTAPDSTSGYDIKAYKPAAVGEYVQVTNGFGRARYTEYVSATEMKAYVETPFFDTDPITSGNWESEHGYEDTWSDTRGWPGTACFHESRLYFGGSTSRPNTIWGSRVIDYFNFDAGTALDDEAVEATINTNQLNKITHLISGPDLQVFTTAAEFVVAQTGTEPITPSNFLIKKQTGYGTSGEIPVIDIDGATIFLQRQKNALIAFQYRDTTASYGTQQLSVLSSHLLTAPVSMAVREAGEADEVNRIFIANANNTTTNPEDNFLTVYTVLGEQNLVAASRYKTVGASSSEPARPLQVCVINKDVYVLNKRDYIGSSSVGYSLEKFDENRLLDCSEAESGWVGSRTYVQMPSLFAGYEVTLIRDGVIDSVQTVPSSYPWRLYFETEPESSYEVGLDFDVEVKTMPAEPRMQNVSIQAVKKRILQVDALVYQSQDMKINGQQVPFRNFGEAVLDTPIAEFTGTKTLHSLLGYSDTGQITITQGVPLKLNLLGMEFKMSVGE